MNTPPTPTPHWFPVVWAELTEDERIPIRHKAQWEQMSLSAVMRDWPSLVPARVRAFVPKPSRD